MRQDQMNLGRAAKGPDRGEMKLRTGTLVSTSRCSLRVKYPMDHLRDDETRYMPDDVIG